MSQILQNYISINSVYVMYAENVLMYLCISVLMILLFIVERPISRKLLSGTYIVVNASGTSKVGI